MAAVDNDSILSADHFWCSTKFFRLSRPYADGMTIGTDKTCECQVSINTTLLDV